MGSVADERLHGLVHFRWAAGFVWVFAYAAAAGPETPPAASSGSVLMLEASPSSRLLYFEQSGGFISSVAKPIPGSAREPMPPLPARNAKGSAPRVPIVRATSAASKP
jgi:hypothetical protein